MHYTNKLMKQNLHRRAWVRIFSLWSLCIFLCVVCVYVCVAVCLGSRGAQLPQLSTLALALKSDGPLLLGCPWTPCSPAHCSLGPRILQMIYYPHTGSAQHLLTSLSVLLPFISLQSFNPACQPKCFSHFYFCHTKAYSRSPVLPLHFIVDSPFFIGIFSSYHCCMSSFCQ